MALFRRLFLKYAADCIIIAVKSSSGGVLPDFYDQYRFSFDFMWYGLYPML